jgi:NADP-dependent 3-hydroxy acid dehydrogenase YdfG
MTSLANHVAVVTGAGSGIGLAIARALREQGATLALVGRRREPLEATLELCGTKGRIYQADLSHEEDLRQAARRLREDHERVDILIHNAAVFRMGPTSEAPLEDFDLQFRTNQRGPFYLTQLLLPALLASQGQVVFINSTAGLIAGRGVAQYAATKHALKALADSLREEVNRQGVRVLSVYCGRTATPMQEEIFAREKRTYQRERLLQPEDVASVVVHSLCLPRTAEVTEIKIRPMQALE